MLRWLFPEIQGTVTIRSSAGRFFRSLQARVDEGLLSGHPHPRSRYVVSASGSDRMVIQAADWWTAVNVGLNSVEIRQDAANTVRYQVRYWRWARYALYLCGGLGLIGLGLLLGFDVRGYLERDPHLMVPGLSAESNVVIAWAMVVLWGFLWPWLLIGLHKRPLHKLVGRLIAEVDSRAVMSAR
jgi:hypothetical protein